MVGGRNSGNNNYNHSSSGKRAGPPPSWLEAACELLETGAGAEGNTHHSASGGASGSSKARRRRGTLLEVRPLWIPPGAVYAPTDVADQPPHNIPSSSSNNSNNNKSNTDGVEGPLYGFVRVEHADHRQSGWHPLHRIFLIDPPPLPPGVSLAALAALAGNRAKRENHGGHGVKGEEKEEEEQEEKGKDAKAQPSPLPPSSSTDCPQGGETEGQEGSNSSSNNNSKNGDGGSNNSTSSGLSAEEEAVLWRRADLHITRAVLSPVYTQVTDGMLRTQSAGHRVGDFMEERLLRDNRTPTTVRRLVYLHRFTFAPWYYAPFGLLNPEYDPMPPPPPPRVVGIAPLPHTGADEAGAGGKGPAGEYGGASLCGGGAVGTAAAGNAYARALTRMQGCIKDAFLCPFSLRLYSTPAQLAWETAQWRGGHRAGGGSPPSPSPLLRPPGTEIYRDEQRGISVLEVNGSREPTFCRQLFLVGKSFLENKLAGHDAMNYLFYVVCLHHRYFPAYVDDPSALYVAGYFSKEKHVTENNLACIVTLPCFAGGAPAPARQPADAAAPAVPRNLGQFMIAFSYELAARRGSGPIGTPERPLSDFGAAAYQRFWRRRLFGWAAAQASLAEGGSSAGGGGSLLGVGKRPRESAGVGASSHASAADTSATTDTADGGNSSSNNTSNNNTSSSLTLRQLARELRLEEADAREALLAAGFLHHLSDDRSLTFMIPAAFVRHTVAAAEAREARLDYATMRPELLVVRRAGGGRGRGDSGSK